MPESGPSIKIFTLEEANAALPRVRSNLRLLREIRHRIIAKQARVDIEEMTNFGRRNAAIDALLKDISEEAASFHRGMEAMQALGCELKDLERGLVDFYAMRGNDVVYLCWMDGEDKIAWWHPLDTGAKGRMPITDQTSL
jgi:hypothetical protein